MSSFNRHAIVAVAFTVSVLLLLAAHRGVSPPSQASNDSNALSANPGKPRYIFVDLGANRADSLEVFLKHPAKFEYDFPRPSWATHEEAEIFLFEANPVFNGDLVRAKEKSGAKGTDLTAVNIATWLLRNTLPHDFVVVKMDIEGAEYEVIPHMADMGAWVVMDHLLVEWHGANVGGGTPEEIELRQVRAKAAMDKLIKEGVNMPAYDSGA
ncbi:hypothetical protein BGZ68_001957 [Mortierella alpina]|nr:hypothetical protein BGZ68_001957 [Mortierella alpina]